MARSSAVRASALFLWLAAVWQNSVRTLMHMPEVSGVQPLGVGVMAVLGFATLLLTARLFRRTFVFLSDTLHRVLPRRVSNVLGVIAAAALLWTIMNGVIFSLTLRVADESYQQVETIVQDDTGRPGDPLKTGSLESLIALARPGRARPKFSLVGSHSGATGRISRCVNSGTDPCACRIECGRDSRGASTISTLGLR